MLLSQARSLKFDFRLFDDCYTEAAAAAIVRENGERKFIPGHISHFAQS